MIDNHQPNCVGHPLLRYLSEIIDAMIMHFRRGISQRALLDTGQNKELTTAADPYGARVAI